MTYDVLVHSGIRIETSKEISAKEAATIAKELIASGWSRYGRGHFKQTVGGCIKQNIRFFKRQ